MYIPLHVIRWLDSQVMLISELEIGKTFMYQASEFMLHYEKWRWCGKLSDIPSWETASWKIPVESFFSEAFQFLVLVDFQSRHLNDNMRYRLFVTNTFASGLRNSWYTNSKQENELEMTGCIRYLYPGYTTEGSNPHAINTRRAVASDLRFFFLGKKEKKNDYIKILTGFYTF